MLRSTLSQLSSPGCVQVEQAHPCHGAECAVPVTWVHFVHLNMFLALLAVAVPLQAEEEAVHRLSIHGRGSADCRHGSDMLCVRSSCNTGPNNQFSSKANEFADFLPVLQASLSLRWVMRKARTVTGVCAPASTQ